MGYSGRTSLIYFTFSRVLLRFKSTFCKECKSAFGCAADSAGALFRTGGMPIAQCCPDCPAPGQKQAHILLPALRPPPLPFPPSLYHLLPIVPLYITPPRPSTPNPNYPITYTILQLFKSCSLIILKVNSYISASTKKPSSIVIVTNPTSDINSNIICVTSVIFSSSFSSTLFSYMNCLL